MIRLCVSIAALWLLVSCGEPYGACGGDPGDCGTDAGPADSGR